MISANLDKFISDMKTLENAVVLVNNRLQRLQEAKSTADQYLGGLTNGQITTFLSSLDVAAIQTAFNTAKATFQATTVLSP